MWAWVLPSNLLGANNRSSIKVSFEFGPIPDRMQHNSDERLLNNLDRGSDRNLHQIINIGNVIFLIEIIVL